METLSEIEITFELSNEELKSLGLSFEDVKDKSSETVTLKVEKKILKFIEEFTLTEEIYFKNKIGFINYLSIAAGFGVSSNLEKLHCLKTMLFKQNEQSKLEELNAEIKKKKNEINEKISFFVLRIRRKIRTELRETIVLKEKDIKSYKIKLPVTAIRAIQNFLTRGKNSNPIMKLEEIPAKMRDYINLRKIYEKALEDDELKFKELLTEMKEQEKQIIELYKEIENLNNQENIKSISQENNSLAHFLEEQVGAGYELLRLPQVAEEEGLKEKRLQNYLGEIMLYQFFEKVLYNIQILQMIIGEKQEQTDILQFQRKPISKIVQQHKDLPLEGREKEIFQDLDLSELLKSEGFEQILIKKERELLDCLIRLIEACQAKTANITADIEEKYSANKNEMGFFKNKSTGNLESANYNYLSKFKDIDVNKLFTGKYWNEEMVGYLTSSNNYLGLMKFILNTKLEKLPAPELYKQKMVSK